MPDSKIKTYNTEKFRDRFMTPGEELNSLLQPDFNRFLIVRVEEMFQLMKLPVPPTRATTHTLIYLTEGEAIMDIGSSTFNIGQGEWLIVPAGQVFSFGNPDINKGYLINFHSDFLLHYLSSKELNNDFEFLNLWGNHKICPDEEVLLYMHQLLNRMLESYNKNGLTNSCLLQAYMLALLTEINTAYKPLSESKKSQSVMLTNQFKNLVFTNIKSMHLVSDYAKCLHITPNHLNKVVKQISGQSPTKWIDETLVLEAKVLLYQTNLQVSEVAAQIGLQDQSYFSRLFKKHEGISPLQFRKRIEKS